MRVFFQIINVLFSLNFGFSQPKPSLRVTLNLFSFIKCIMLSVVCVQQIYLHEGIFRTLWFCLHLVFYLFSVSYLSFSKTDATFCNLHVELQKIDTKLKVDDASYNLEIKIMLTILACVIHRLVSTLFFCVLTDNCLKPYWASFIFLLLFNCLAICFVCYMFIFLSANCRLKTLSLALETTETNFISLQCIYKMLVDITEKYKNAFDPIVSTYIIFGFPIIFYINILF